MFKKFIIILFLIFTVNSALAAQTYRPTVHRVYIQRPYAYIYPRVVMKHTCYSHPIQRYQYYYSVIYQPHYYRYYPRHYIYFDYPCNRIIVQLRY